MPRSLVSQAGPLAMRRVLAADATYLKRSLTLEYLKRNNSTTSINCLNRSNGSINCGKFSNPSLFDWSALPVLDQGPTPLSSVLSKTNITYPTLSVNSFYGTNDSAMPSSSAFNIFLHFHGTEHFKF
jgi:hypothetical protein